MNNNENIITANSNYITRTFANTLVKFTRTTVRAVNGKPELFTEEIATQFKGKMTVEQAQEVRGMLVEDFLKYSVPVQRPASQQDREG